MIDKIPEQDFSDQTILIAILLALLGYGLYSESLVDPEPEPPPSLPAPAPPRKPCPGPGPCPR